MSGLTHFTTNAGPVQGDTMRLCIECEHYRANTYAARSFCARDVQGKVSPVNGHPLLPTVDCEKERAALDLTRCGPDGRFWKLRVGTVQVNSLYTTAPLYPMMVSSVAPAGMYMNNPPRQENAKRVLPKHCFAERAPTRLERLRWRLFKDRGRLGVHEGDLRCTGPYEHEGPHMDAAGNRWED